MMVDIAVMTVVMKTREMALMLVVAVRMATVMQVVDFNHQVRGVWAERVLW